MKRPLRIARYLRDISEAIERIDRYTLKIDEAEFLSHEMIQDAVIRNIEIMGEASNKILREDPAFAG